MRKMEAKVPRCEPPNLHPRLGSSTRYVESNQEIIRGLSGSLKLLDTNRLPVNRVDSSGGESILEALQDPRRALGAQNLAAAHRHT